MDYTKTCWFCGKDTIQPKDSYFQCSECGATWNEQPEPGYYMDIASDTKGPSSTKSYHPVRKSRRQIAGLTAEQRRQRKRSKSL